MLETRLTSALLLCGICAHAQINFHTTVSNLWYQGHKTNVLAMAEARLAQNSNDKEGE